MERVEERGILRTLAAYEEGGARRGGQSSVRVMRAPRALRRESICS